MRQIYLITITLSLILTSSFTQKVQNTTNVPLSKAERLYYICKIWGFVKYYHPLVGKGSFDWDEKMQKLINTTNNIQTHEDLAAYMARWIYYLGQFKECTSCNQRSEKELFLKNFDLSWTQSNLFTDDLKKSLKNIENNRFQGSHHYVGQGSVQEFEPKNELPHDDLNWKDENQRLLPLFRYWNYIEYFYPYKYLTDQSWDEVLKEMIPKFLAANTQQDFHLAMLELIVKVDDSHAGLITPVLDKMPYYNYLPAKFELIENQAVITEIIDREKSLQADIQVGDIIKTVNGQSVQNLHNSNKKYIWGSNEAVKDRSVYHTLFMGLQTPAQVTIDRNGTVRSASLNLYKYSDLSYVNPGSKPKWTSPRDSIGYVNMGELSVGDVDGMMSEFMDKTVIIFDIRNNPRGTYKAIAKYLNPSDTVFTIFTKPDYSYPGKFIWDGESRCGEANPDYFKGKVILLVNEETQSHAEFTCMSLQTAPNVVTIGSQTAGTDGKVTKFPIYARHYTSMSGIGVYYPDKSETQRVGIVPDIVVEPTIAGIRDGRDEILEKAMKVAQEEIVRLIAEARARELARLDSLARVDSIRIATLRMDSIRLDSMRMMMPIDSANIDSLKIDNEGGN